MKYRFEILYQTQKLKQVSDFLANCDLNTGEMAMYEKIEITHKNDVEISYLKDLITQAYASAECKIVKIEGGKFE